ATMLTVHLLRSHGSSERPPIPHRGGRAPRRMRRVPYFIDGPLTDQVGVGGLPPPSELEPPPVWGGLKNFIGKTPHRFLTERRVRRALELLRDKDRSIVEIARAAGFSSQSRLTENFRRVMRLTPARFRRSLS